MYTLTKRFGLVYGHRLWNQTAPPCQCRHLHGHSGHVIISVTNNKIKEIDTSTGVWQSHNGDTLNQGMVMDLNNLKHFKTELEWLDHKMILDKNDPLVPIFLGLGGAVSMENRGPFVVVSAIGDTVEDEIVDGLVLMDGEPTSENLARLIYHWVNEWLPDGVWCDSVAVEETESNRAEYRL